MNTGELNQRVLIERFTSEQNELGEMLETWGPLCSVWAAVEPLSGREYFAASAAQSQVTTRIKMRYRPGITSIDRVVHDGTTYGIESVIDYKSANRQLVLMCRSI